MSWVGELDWLAYLAGAGQLPPRQDRVRVCLSKPEMMAGLTGQAGTEKPGGKDETHYQHNAHNDGGPGRLDKTYKLGNSLESIFTLALLV